MHITDSELGGISTQYLSSGPDPTLGGLTIGDSRSGDVIFDGISDSNSDDFELLVLKATKAGKIVTFAGGESSFNKGITIQAAGGIVFSTSMSTKQTTTVLHAGTGFISVLSNATLSSTSTALLMTCDDIFMNGTVSSGTGSVTLTRTTRDGIAVGIDSQASDLHMSMDQLDSVIGAGLTIGDQFMNTDIVVTGVDGSTMSVEGIITLVATVDDSKITFSAGASVFYSLAAQADNGVTVQADLSSAVGTLYLDADFENSSSADSEGRLLFGDVVTVDAKTFMTLEATTGTLNGLGSLTLNSGMGITLTEDLIVEGQLVISADTDQTPPGDLVVFAGRAITTESSIFITASDLDFAGGVSCAGSLLVKASIDAANIGVGNVAAHAVTLDSNELDKVTASGLMLGHPDNGSITVAALSETSSKYITGIVTLLAVRDKAHIRFAGGASVFTALTAQADDGIFVEVDSKTNVADMLLEADYDNSADTDDRLLIVDGRVLQSEGLMTLDSTSGGIVSEGIGVAQLLAKAGVLINNNVTSDQAGTKDLVINGDLDGSGSGTVTLTSSRMITTNGGALTITAADIQIGLISASGGAVALQSSTGASMGIGLSSRDLYIDSEEITRITAGGMVFGNDVNGDVLVDGLTEDMTNAISGVFSVLATGSNSQVHFKNTASTFNALSVQTGNGVVVNRALTTDIGDLVIDGDTDHTLVGDRRDRVTIASALTLEAEESMRLAAHSGGILYLGRLTLNARNGITVASDMVGTSGLFIAESDIDNDATGTFTITSGYTFNSRNSNILITAADLDFAGSITAGERVITIHNSGVNRTIALSTVASNMQLEPEELGRTTANAGLTLGSSTSGDITVGAVLEQHSQSTGRVTLLATSAGKSVTFENNNCSFNKGITVQAADGIQLLQSVSTKQSYTMLDGGTGTLTVAPGSTLSTTNQYLVLTADEIDLQVSSQIDAGTASVAFAPKRSRSIGLGAATGQDLDLTISELQTVEAAGLTIGCDGVNKGIVVSNVTQPSSNGISMIVSLVATTDHSQIIFEGYASTFGALVVSADNGIVVNADITTTIADLWLDGDADDLLGDDAHNNIGIVDGRVVTSKQTLTLESTTGIIARAGVLTLEAGAGIVILDDLMSSTLGTRLVLDADSDHQSEGTLTLAVGRKIVSNNGEIIITASDVDIPGEVEAGTAAIVVHMSQEEGLMALGAAQQQLTVSKTELEIMGCGGLVMGSSTNGSISVDGVSALNSDSVTGMLSLVASRDNARVLLTGADSTFNQLCIQADDGVQVGTSIFADTGELTIDSDLDLSAIDDTSNAIVIDGSRTLQAGTTLTLRGESAGVVRENFGTVSFRSSGGILIEDGLISTESAQPLIIGADNDATGDDGVITVGSNSLLSTNNGLLVITASDLDILGEITAGSTAMQVLVSNGGMPIELGGNPAGGVFGWSSSELQRVTAGGLTLGSTRNGSITVADVPASASDMIQGVVTLVATGSLAQISFTQAASTFRALVAQADDGIDVHQSLTTTDGLLSLNGDSDSIDDGTTRDHIVFAAGVALTSAGEIDLTAPSGKIKLEGALTLNSAGSIYIHDAFLGPYGSHGAVPVVFNPDTDNDGVGVLDVAAGACSQLSDCASCTASRLCGWCSHPPREVGLGLVTSSGTDGTIIIGAGTSFVTDGISPGSLLTVNGQTRQITNVMNETYLTISSNYSTVAAGSSTVYANSVLVRFSGAVERVQVVGSAPTAFGTAAQRGYTITAANQTHEIAAIHNSSSLDTNNTFTNSATSEPYTFGGIPGAGRVTSDGSIMLHGSWPPMISRFSTQVKPGYTINAANQSRVVYAVHSDQLIELETAFEFTFSNEMYTISNIPGAGVVTVTAGSTAVVGVTAEPSQFDSQLRPGDLISMAGHSTTIVTVDDAHHATVLESFPSGLIDQPLHMHTIHSRTFTVAKPLSGQVYSSGRYLNGIGTYFGQELQVSFSLLVEVQGEFETRTVEAIVSDTQVLLDAALSVDIPSSNPVSVFYESCGSQLPDYEPSDAGGTFALHAKASRPKTCFSTGHCAPRSSHAVQFEVQGSGNIFVAANSTTLFGEHSQFGAQVQAGSTVSVLRGSEHQSRVVTTIQSDTQLTLDKPFSFEIEAWFEQQYLVRPITGKGTLYNPADSRTVTGTGTQFRRDLQIGWVVAVGLSKRLITSVDSNTQLTVNAPFADEDVSDSAWSFDSCIDDNAFPDATYAEGSCELEPGCCGFQVGASIQPEQYAYYMVQPTHSDQVVRVEVSSPSPVAELQVTLGVGAAPDDIKYDFRAVGQLSPWHLELPQKWVQCSGGTCLPVYIGIKGPPTVGLNASLSIPYTVSAFSEFSFAEFSCSAESSALGECQQQNTLPVGNTTVRLDSTEESALQLTPASPFQVGAAWYHQKLHLEDGFESSFQFRLTSDCTKADAPDNCAAGDGFSFVLFGGDNPTFGCGNSALGYANALTGEQDCAGLWPSFVVEFDTYHNPELRDINARGVGTLSVNATEVLRYNYEHAAFFAFDEAAGTASHEGQLAGTPSIPSIADGQLHVARLVYIPGSGSSNGRIFLYIDDMQSFVLTAPIRLARAGTCTVPNVSRKCVLDELGNAFIGFTAATGESGQQHDIVEWQYCDEPNCGR
jgi:hypothetical protein